MIMKLSMMMRVEHDDEEVEHDDEEVEYDDGS